MALRTDIREVINEPSDILAAIITQVRKLTMSNLEDDGSLVPTGHKVKQKIVIVFQKRTAK